MNRLVTIIGPSGIGKTSLVHALIQSKFFSTALEQHDERPFQMLAKNDSKYMCANQMDYLLLRAEQERGLRAAKLTGLMDGGLDLDFHGFTRLFLNRNLLNQDEFNLCQRLYNFFREWLPLPDLIVRLRLDGETVADRLSGRKRINIASAKDITLFESFLDEWLRTVPSNRILELDVTNEAIDYSHSVKAILDTISQIF